MFRATNSTREDFLAFFQGFPAVSDVFSAFSDDFPAPAFGGKWRFLGEFFEFDFVGKKGRELFRKRRKKSFKQKILAFISLEGIFVNFLKFDPRVDPLTRALTR